MVRYVLDSVGVSLHGFLVVFLLGVYKDLDESENWLAAVALGELVHGALDQVESLLEIVEAYNRVDAIPVQKSIFNECALDKFAVDLLVVHQIKKQLESQAVCELFAEVPDWWIPVLLENLVYNFT